MPRQPTTLRGSRTVEGLLHHALEVFAARGYHGASVSAICRGAGVANGSFYQYFRDKHAVFAALAAQADEALGEALARARTLVEMIDHLFDSFEANGRLFQVFREAEFVSDDGVVRAFYAPLVARIEASLGVDEPTAWSLLGAQIFLALRFAVWGGERVSPSVRRTFTAFAQAGLGETGTTLWEDIRLPDDGEAPVPLPAQDRADRTRLALLDAAHACFSDRGYATTHVADITRRAGVAQGTFYRYFAAKRDVLAAVLDDIRADLTARTCRLHGAGLGRLEEERRNLLVFLDGVKRDVDIYRLVREAEFAEPAIGRGYYEAIATGYALLLGSAQARGEVRCGDAETLAWAVMGVAHTAGMRWVLWEGGRAAPVHAVRATLRFVLRGLERL